MMQVLEMIDGRLLWPDASEVKRGRRGSEEKPMAVMATDWQKMAAVRRSNGVQGIGCIKE
uniref:Predicted protein n=1 Tax=Hordeum vulgare subsp. vulgare TaxID=112509 RepID=F2E0P6_HORVV|nr:predicted protein [Hordeum vulgare subsp. vulgare]